MEFSSHKWEEVEDGDNNHKWEEEVDGDSNLQWEEVVDGGKIMDIDDLIVHIDTFLSHFLKLSYRNISAERMVFKSLDIFYFNYRPIITCIYIY